MVIETFKRGAEPVYERAASRDDCYRPVSSTSTAGSTRGLGRFFQLMETDDPKLLNAWIAAWRDLVDFEVVPVLTSIEAAARVDARTPRATRRA